MQNSVKKRAVLAGAAFLATVSCFGAADAQVYTVTGPQIGADGTPGTGTSTDGVNYYGDDAEQGFTAPNGALGTSFLVQNATAQGGVGGAIVGSDTTGTNYYQAGDGGNGLLSQAGSSVVPLVTIQSGTFTGGAGGAASGVGALIVGGTGGGGLDVNNSTVIVNGGTFTGGPNGVGTGPDAFFNYSPGAGLNANYDGVITINGGSFTGGNGVGGTGNGPGILGLGTDDGFSTVDIFGGTFAGGDTPGQSSYGIDLFGGIITLHGSDFTINGLPAYNGETITSGTGTITGLLEDNSAVTSITYDNENDGGIIVLSSVPEPTSLALLAVGSAGLLARTRRRNRG